MRPHAPDDSLPRELYRACWPCIGGAANRALPNNLNSFGCSRALDSWKDRKLSADEVEDCCGAGVTPVRFRALGSGKRDPQAQIRLGAHPRPGEESCCYLIAHGEVAQVRSLGNEARSTRAVSRRAEEVRDQQRTLSPGRQATKN